MIIRLVKIALVLIFFSFVQSCKKSSTSFYLLTDEMRNTIPFVSKEKTFFVQGNDTILLEADFRVNRQYRYNCGNSTNTYCVREINDINFFSDSAYFMSLSMVNGDGLDSPRLTLEWKQGKRYYDSGKASFDLPLSPSNLKEGQFYIDVLMVQGNTFAEVYCDSIVSPVDSDEHIVKTIYYSKEAGIIRVDLKTGEIIELVQINW